MKLVDRYILRGFVFSFLVVFISMVALTIMVDMAMNIDEFMKVGEDTEAMGAWSVVGHVGRYYFFRTFEYFQWLCGAAMLVGGAFAVARLNKSNELVAFKASGVSVYRLMWPIIAASLVVTVVYIVNQEFIIPNIMDQLVADRSAAEGAEEFEIEHVRDANNALVFAPRYLPKDQIMEAKITYAPDGKTILTREPISIAVRDPKTDENRFFIEADRAVYNEAQRRWDLVGGVRFAVVETEGTESDEIVSEPEPCPFFVTDLDPTTITRQRRDKAFRYLSFRHLGQLLKESALLRATLYEVAMHQHFSKPILNIIVLLLGLPFVVGQEGKSYLISIMICIGLFVLVLGTEHVASEFGNFGHIPPILAAYLPVLVFTPVAILCMDGVRT